MSILFADTFYFLALLNPGDEGHAKALQVSTDLRRPIVTTAWVLTELADALASPVLRVRFANILALLKSNPRATILPPTSELFEAGLHLFLSRSDKGWSLTDCISFAVMKERNITEARHFQAG